MKFVLESYKTENGALNASKMSSIADLVGAKVFVETGTYLGDTAFAMRNVFAKVYSIELSEAFYHAACDRFARDGNITLLLGESSDTLRKMSVLSEPAASVFWLDAHWSGGNTARASANTPIIEELRAIWGHGFSRSIIVVDDIRYFISVPEGFEVHEANYGYPLLRDLLAEVRRLWPNHVPLINGDLLFIFPEVAYRQLEVSPVIAATNSLRRGVDSCAGLTALEGIVGATRGEEREAIMELPNTFKPSLRYGIGGEYLYWRSLVHEHDGALDSALSDLTIARKCGVHVPVRQWEIR